MDDGRDTRAALFVEHARRYAGLGWTLLDLDGKKPRRQGWQKTRFADPDGAAGMWSVYGKAANMGVLLGASGLIVVEPDTPAAHERLLELLGGQLPVTPTVQSGGKSVHLYFADDGLGPAERDGLELRGGAQQTVVPPSTHPGTGRPYVWHAGREPWDVPPLLVPELVRAYFARENGKHGQPTLVGDEIHQPGRHRTLLSLAGTMRRRGLGFDEIAAALRATNELRCRPPLPDEEVVELVADVVRRYEPAPPDHARVRLEAEADRLFAAWTPSVEADVEEPAPHARRRQAGPLIVSLVEFLGGSEDDAAWLVDHLAARGALVLVAGLPKVGKSTFVYGLLGALTSPADRFVGLPAGSTSALLMTEEPPATVEEKVDRFAVDDERVFVISKRKMGGGRTWPKTVAAAVAFCRARPEVGVCVVDTWDKFVGLSSHRSEADTGVIVEAIEPLYELLGLGVCVILITHQRKEEGSHGLRVRGGTALTGSADVIVEVERAPESAGLTKSARVVKIVSRFAGAPDEIAVELGEEEWRSLGTVAAAKRRARSDEIVAVLGDEPRTLEELLAIDTLAGTSRMTLRRRLEDLVRTGLADRIGEGKRHDPFRWLLSENGRIFRTTFVPAGSGGFGGGGRDPADRAENSPAGFVSNHPGARGPDGWEETLDCPNHPGPHKVVKRAAGYFWLACGCRFAEPA